MRIRLSLVSAAALSAALASHAHAQSVDYGQLEQLFGEPVTTSATGSPQKASDAPANMTIITADDIRRSGADNIPDILKFIAGIDVTQSGFASQNVAIRGYSQVANPRLLVLVNGRQVYLDDYGYVAWQTLPVQLDEIRQIEVVKGPASALFGFNAVSGVINIITYDPLSDSTNVATLRGGTQSNVSGDAVATVHDGDKAGLKMSVGGYKASEFKNTDLPSGVGAIDNSPYQHSFSLDGRAKLASNVEATAEVTQSQAQNYSNFIGDTPATTDYRTDSFKTGFAADTNWGLLNMDAYRNENRFRLSAARTGTINEVQDIYVVQASDLFKLGTANTFRVSFEYRSNNAKATGFDHSIGYQDYAASGMWNWQIASAWALTNSVRLDYLSLGRNGAPVTGSPFTLADFDNATITEPSFNTGLVYKPTDNDTFRFLIGRSVQAPSLVDYGLNTVAGPVAIIGNPDLSASTVMNYEVDYDRSLPAIQSTLRTAVYYEDTQNILNSAVTEPVALENGLLVKESQNIGHSDAVGGEVGLKGSNDAGWRWNASYALVSITDHLASDITGAATGIDYQHGTPTSVIDLGIGRSWSKFEADLYAKWQSSFTDYTPASNYSATDPVLRQERINDYVTFTARLGYNVNDRLTLALSGQQLNQERIIEASGLPTDRRVIISATLKY